VPFCSTQHPAAAAAAAAQAMLSVGSPMLTNFQCQPLKIIMSATERVTHLVWPKHSAAAASKVRQLPANDHRQHNTPQHRTLPHRSVTQHVCHLEWHVEAVELATVLPHIPNVTSAREEVLSILVKRHLQQQQGNPCASALPCPVVDQLLCPAGSQVCRHRRLERPHTSMVTRTVVHRPL
jgi:hypothetical protein